MKTQKIQVVKCSDKLMWYNKKTFPFKTNVIEAALKIDLPHQNVNYNLLLDRHNAEDLFYSEELAGYIIKSDCINDEDYIFKEQKDFETKKFDDNKPSFSNIPQKALWELMKVFKVGESKYGKYNHSLGCNHTRLADGAVRHISQYLMSEDIDEETKTHHLANAAANCLMLLDQIMNGTGTDNRNTNYKKQK